MSKLLFKKKFIYKNKKLKKNQEHFLLLFDQLSNNINLTNFEFQKKILYLLDNNIFNKKLNVFINLYLLPIEVKNFILNTKEKFLAFLKLKKKRKFKIKKLDFYFKLLLLNNYSLFFNINNLKKNFFLKKKKTKSYLLYINIRSNNIFVNLFSYNTSKLILIKFWSCGILKLVCTKRKLKFTIYTILKEIKQQIKYISFFIVKIFCAHFLHKFLYKNLKKLFFRFKFIIFNSFKIFNGCRSKKKRRKKHLKFRIFR